MRDEQPNARDRDGLTALHRAVAAGDLALCQRLLQAGADINARSGRLIAGEERSGDEHWEPGDTPLILAAKHRHADIVAHLLERRANGKLSNAVRWGPLHAAVVGGDERAADLIIRAGADLELHCIASTFDEQRGWSYVGTPLHVSANWNRPSMARLMIMAGADISASWSDRRTPLFYAAARGSTAVMDLLCDHGADPTLREHRNENGNFLDWTPLHYAARNGHAESVAALLRHGADSRARDSHSGETAAEMARDAD